MKAYWFNRDEYLEGSYNWYVSFALETISMGWSKKDVTPLLQHWRYIFLALTHRY